jgi:hypothetical protein
MCKGVIGCRATGLFYHPALVQELQTMEAHREHVLQADVRLFAHVCCTTSVSQPFRANMFRSGRGALCLPICVAYSRVSLHIHSHSESPLPFFQLYLRRLTFSRWGDGIRLSMPSLMLRPLWPRTRRRLQRRKLIRQLLPLEMPRGGHRRGCRC